MLVCIRRMHMHITHVPTFHFVSRVIRARVYVYDSGHYEIMYMTTSNEYLKNSWDCTIKWLILFGIKYVHLQDINRNLIERIPLGKNF